MPEIESSLNVITTAVHVAAGVDDDRGAMRRCRSLADGRVRPPGRRGRRQPDQERDEHCPG